MRPRLLLTYAGIFVFGVILQFGWLHFLAPAGLAPNFLLIFVVMTGLARGSFWGQIMGFAWGIVWGALSMDLFGAHALVFTCIGYLAGYLSHRWNESKLVTQLVVVGTASFVYLVGMSVVTQFFGGSVYRYSVNYITLTQPFYNMLVAPVLFRLGTGVTSFINREY